MLFVRNGQPLRFYIAPSNPERVTLQPLIEKGGGVFLKSWSAGERRGERCSRV
jgi:hypothetical protein